MKTSIYYFSGTGNSLAIAKDLARELNAVELIHMVKMLSNPAQSQADIIGLVFPVYFQNLPKIVEEFIKKMIFDNHQYIFSVVTNNEYPGNTLFFFKAVIKAKRISSGCRF